MTEADYEQVVRNSLQRFRELYGKREQIDTEMGKLRQFLYAALNMVPDAERDKWEREIDKAVEEATSQTASLAGAIRKVFRQNSAMLGFTIGGMLQELNAAGFDFSSYRSNPLSSISTTLRRMAETGELEIHHDREGPALYVLSRKMPKKK